MTARSYGTWDSPITAQLVAAQGLRLGYPSIHDGDDVYWLEGRPAEGGRNVLVRRAADGRVSDVTPAGLNVRTRVHEYGGGAYAIVDGVPYFSNFADQRVYQGDRPLTPQGAWCYADYEVDRRRRRLICVREDQTGSGEPVNAIVAVSMETGAVDVLASGYDFYSTPRLSAGGTRLCWIAWRHPNMPWDGTELWVADVAADGTLANAQQVAGGERESIFQPGWHVDGTLIYCSDRSGYWQVCTTERTLTRSEPDAEFGRPQWLFGWACWASIDAQRLLVSFTRGGRWFLGTLELGSGRVSDLLPGIEPGEWLSTNGRKAAITGASPTSAASVLLVDLASGAAETLRSAASVAIEPGDVSQAEAIEFPTRGSRTAHAFFYPPHHPDVEASGDEAPPLIVISHGGPTTATKDTLDLSIQFWTSRGFGVVDVNYGGSSGYGREYRERLNGEWGHVDVDDCVNAALFLAKSGRVDRTRMAIRGGSAGGYTTLAALTFHPGVFAAGASYYGISDIEVLARDTHKFESRYLDTLVGPYPEARDEYRARSPIHFVDRLACPMILLQGLEDKVVPPNQAEMMAAAVRAKGLPVELILFEGEQHGFRRAETIVRSLEAELAFYRSVLQLCVTDAR